MSESLTPDPSCRESCMGLRCQLGAGHDGVHEHHDGAIHQMWPTGWGEMTREERQEWARKASYGG